MTTKTMTIGIKIDTAGFKLPFLATACLYGAAVLNWIGFKRITSSNAAEWAVRRFLKVDIKSDGDRMTARFVKRPLFRKAA
jgi:hypothetical protein